MKRLGTSGLGKWMMTTALVACIAPASTYAQAKDEVLLKSADGSISVTGKLLEFTDEFYVLQTSLGNLRVSAERVSCVGTACPVIEVAEADIQIAGADAFGDGLMPLLLDGYGSFVEAEASIAKTNVPGQFIASMIADQGFGDEMGSYLVTSSSTTIGFEQLLEGQAQITMASRRILPAEARALKKAGAGNMISPDQEHIVAVDSIAVVTHETNPINSLTIQQLADIYSGAVTNWSQLGGPDMAILPVGHSSEGEVTSIFNTRVFGTDDPVLTSKLVLGDGFNEVANLVNDTPGAIAYTGFAFLRGTKPISVVNECNIAMVPDSFSAKTEEYGLQRRMYLYNRADAPAETVGEFLGFAVSEAADNVILKSGFIDLGIETRAQDTDSARAQALLNASFDQFERNIADEILAEMAQYDRLSTTFRFRTASARLDERGQRDMKRLVEYLGRQGPGTEVLLVGFTDDVGAFSANLELSKRRAEEMVHQLEAELDGKVDGVSVRSTGYGSMAPSACNVSDQGRSINRRVEVWIKRGA